jgi:hypothetical protein
MVRRGVVGAMVALTLAGAAGGVGWERGASGAEPQADLIPAREVRRLQQAGQVALIVDVRSQPEYVSRHITGAVSVPVNEIEQRAREIPRSGLVVLY